MANHRAIPHVFRILGVMTLAAAAADGAVFTVGPGAFPTIQSAVNASTNGDVVLVKTGMYAAFTIDGHGVTVVADSGANVATTGVVTIKNVPAGSNVALVRLLMQGQAGGAPVDGRALEIANCAGHVRVEACTIRGLDGGPLVNCAVIGEKDAFSAVRTQNCADVAILLCDLRGGKAMNLFAFPQCDGEPLAGGVGGHGLDAIDSHVTIYDSTLKGGDGGTAWYYGGNAGDGCRLTTTAGAVLHSELFASNVVFDGKTKGGDAWDYFGVPITGGGGSGLYSAGSTTVRTLDCEFLGGTGGCNLFGCDGAYPAIVGPNSVLPGTSKGFGAPRLLREGQTAPFVFAGQAGDAAYLMLSPSMGSVFVPSLRGEFLLASPLVGPLSVGSIPPIGTLAVSLTVPFLPPGILGASVELQAMLLSSTGVSTLTTSAHVTILSATL